MHAAMRDGKGIFDVVEVPPEALAILGGDWGESASSFPNRVKQPYTDGDLSGGQTPRRLRCRPRASRLC